MCGLFNVYINNKSLDPTIGGGFDVYNEIITKAPTLHMQGYLTFTAKPFQI